MQKMLSLFLTRAGPGELAVVSRPTHCAAAPSERCRQPLPRLAISSPPHICMCTTLTPANASFTDGSNVFH